MTDIALFKNKIKDEYFFFLQRKGTEQASNVVKINFVKCFYTQIDK